MLDGKPSHKEGKVPIDCSLIQEELPKPGHLFTWYSTKTATTEISARGGEDYLQLVQLRNDTMNFSYSTISGWESITNTSGKYEWLLDFGYRIANQLKTIKFNLHFEMQGRIDIVDIALTEL